MFALAIVEKVATLKSGAAQWHPVIIVSSWRRRHATFLVGAAVALDSLTVAALVSKPRLGGAVACGTIGAYTLAARRVQFGAEGCRCLNRRLDAHTTTGFVVRNLVLVGFGAVTLLLGADAWRYPDIVAACVFLCVVVLATRAGDLVDRSKRRELVRQRV